MIIAWCMYFGIYDVVGAYFWKYYFVVFYLKRWKSVMHRGLFNFLKNVVIF